VYGGVANLNDPDFDVIKMKQILVQAAGLGSPKLDAEAYVYIQLLNSKTLYYVGGC
jgi:hypothetical protein